MNPIIKLLLRSGYVKSLALAKLRALLIGLGPVLIAKGYVDDTFWTEFVGSVVTLAGLYWQFQDVDQVDKKINAALDTPSTVTSESPESVKEKEITKQLNIAAKANGKYHGS